MAQSQDTVREIFVPSAGVLALDAGLTAFVNASDNFGEIYIGAADGGTSTGAGTPFVIAVKTAAGDLFVSDKYSANQIGYAKAFEYAAAALKAVDVTPIIPTAGLEYILEIRMQNAGSLSVEDFYIKKAQYVGGQNGDALTVAAVCTGLVASLNKNFSREAGATASTNPYFTFTDGTTKITITGKNQPLQLGKDEGRPLEFEVRMDKVLGASLATIAATAQNSPGIGTGKSVAIMEHFYRGNRGDQFREQHFPNNWGLATKSTAAVAGTYALIEMTAIRKQDEMFNITTSRKQATIAVPFTVGSGDYTAMNVIINRLELFINQTIADFAVTA
jgi:hypothetical protein